MKGNEGGREGWRKDGRIERSSVEHVQCHRACMHIVLA